MDYQEDRKNLKAPSVQNYWNNITMGAPPVTAHNNQYAATISANRMNEYPANSSTFAEYFPIVKSEIPVTDSSAAAGTARTFYNTPSCNNNFYYDFPNGPENLAANNSAIRNFPPQTSFQDKPGSLVGNKQRKSKKVTSEKKDNNAKANSANSSTPSTASKDFLSSFVSSISTTTYSTKNGTKWFKLPVHESETSESTSNEIEDFPELLNEPPKQQEKRNIGPGLTEYSSNSCNTPLECWELLFTEEMLDMIVEYTNQQTEKSTLKNRRSETDEQLTRAELKAFFGLLYLSAVFSAGRGSTDDFWSTDGTGLEIFRLTMSSHRFSYLQGHLKFEDIDRCKELEKIDNLAPIRQLSEDFSKNCCRAYNPGEVLHIYDKLEPYKGPCPIRHYIVNTHTHSGIRYFTLIDTNTFYTYNLEIDGKKQPEHSYYNISYQPKDIVERLVDPILKTERVLILNSRYTSYELCKKLLKDHKLYSVAHLTKNRDFLPTELTSQENFKNRNIGSSEYAFQNDITVVSYKGSETQNRIFLSTHHRKPEENKMTQRPEIVHFYDIALYGVESIQNVWAEYSVSRKSFSWTTKILFSILDLCGTNAEILYRLKNNNSKKSKEEMNRRKFLKQIGLNLVKEELQKRAVNPFHAASLGSKKKLCELIEIDSKEVVRKSMTNRKTSAIKRKKEDTDSSSDDEEDEDSESSSDFTKSEDDTERNSTNTSRQSTSKSKNEFKKERGTPKEAKAGKKKLSYKELDKLRDTKAVSRVRCKLCKGGECRSKNVCSSCEINMCTNHAVLICYRCASDLISK